MIGRTLGPYELLAKVGEGGMGEVYKARDTRLDRSVAVKVLPARLAADPEFRERFGREAKAISALSHPNICTLLRRRRVDEYDVTRDGQRFLFVRPKAGPREEPPINVTINWTSALR